MPDGGTVSPSADSVLRFYATWWAGAGLVMWRLAAAPERHPAAVRAVAATTFVGGLARLLAARHSGPPHPLFRALTVLELVADAARRATAARSRPAGVLVRPVTPAAPARRAQPVQGRRASSGVLSVRSPRHAAWRSLPSAVSTR